MFREIFHFLINVSTNLFGEILLLRAWFAMSNVPGVYPIMFGLKRLTDWFILPLRRVRFIDRWNKLDLTVLCGAWIVALFHSIAIILLFGIRLDLFLADIFIVSFFLLCKWILNLVAWSAILYVLMSWINPLAPAMFFIGILLNPLLTPLRKFLPHFRAIDLSSMVLLVIITLLQAILNRFGMQFGNIFF